RTSGSTRSGASPSKRSASTASGSGRSASLSSRASSACSSPSPGWPGRADGPPNRRPPAEREGGMRLERGGPYLWRIPQDAGRGMGGPALVVADDRLIESIRSDASLDQIANGATLPGIVKAAMAMPDIHQGYGLPVGGVVATDAREGVVSPGAIGFDINCGVRL